MSSKDCFAAFPPLGWVMTSNGNRELGTSPWPSTRPARVALDANLVGLDEYVQHFRLRVLQDAMLEATAVYWLRRARAFEDVGTATCDEIATACRNRAALSLGREPQ